MKSRNVLLVSFFCALILTTPLPRAGGAERSVSKPAVADVADAGAAPDVDWYFAVSGDSRDCGDIIMPKIARTIADRHNTPAQFYWHLGDFRAIYRIDCDIIKRTDPAFQCPAPSQQ